VTSAASAYWSVKWQGWSRTIRLEPYHTFGWKRTLSCSGLCCGAWPSHADWADPRLILALWFGVKAVPLWSTIAWLVIDYRSQFSELRWYNWVGFLTLRLRRQCTSYIDDARKKREANLEGWYEVGRVAGIFVDVYFGRIVHGKHAVGASGICTMPIIVAVAAPIPA
jgi:hypothetical protein